MSGIRTTSREEALAALLRRTRHEVAQARRAQSPELSRLLMLQDRLHLELGIPLPVKPTSKPRQPSPTGAQEQMRQLGVTSLQVKTWALEQGLIRELKRGRVPPDLVEAYAAQHRTPSPHLSNGVNAQA